MKLILLSLLSCASALWPIPSAVSLGSQTVPISPTSFTIHLTGAKNSILKKAVARYEKLLFPVTSTHDERLAYVNTLVINVSSSSESLQLGTDESYHLSVNSASASITAATVFGALHGLETFSQLVSYNGTYSLKYVPVLIDDVPRFAHRGFLMDTARHFLPLSTIMRTIDALSYNKMNVLHWHIVDAESFPLESTSYPKLSKGAWSRAAVYSTTDVAAVIQYGIDRGVRVLPEFDTPGHTASWGIGYPGITTDCPKWNHNVDNVNLDPSNPEMWQVVSGLMKEMTALFTDDFFHIGGDEVVYQCWDDDPAVVAWMKQNGYDDDTYMQYYEDQMWNLMKQNGKTPIVWEEVFNLYRLKNFPSNLVVEVWKDEPTLLSVAEAGLHGLLAYGWYLDHRADNWTSFYMHEPFDSDKWTPELEALIHGGEVCAWGEELNTANYDGEVWPRAAAAAERLWSPKDETRWRQAEERLIEQICHMNGRGIMAAPIRPGVCAGLLRLQG